MPIVKRTRDAICKMINRKSLGKTNRFYTNFKGVGYLRHSAETVLSGESVTVSSYVIGDGRIIDGSDYIEINSGVVTLSSNLTGTIDGAVIESGVTNVTLNKILNITIVAAADTSFSYISSPTNPINGFVYDVQYPNRFFSISESHNDLLEYKDDQRYLGQELYQDGDITGVFNGYDTISTINGFDVTKSYRVEFIYSVEIFRIRFYFESLTRLYIASNVLTNSIMFPTTSYVRFQNDGSDNNNVSIVGLSIKETSSAQGFNITSDDITPELPK
jgi:hypothetical protein